MSTRSNAVLFDCLSLVELELTTPSVRLLAREKASRFARAASSPLAKLLLRLSAFAVLAWGLVDLFGSDFKLSDLGIEFLASLLLLSISWTKRV